MTAAGADGVLAKLMAVGLIARRPGRAGGFCVATDRSIEPDCGATLVVNIQDASNVDELDAAIVDLDRSLASPASSNICLLVIRNFRRVQRGVG